MENRIRQLRKERHMTQAALSRELGISQEAISAYEGGRNVPSAASLVRLSRIFHASTDYILGLTDVRMPSRPKGRTAKVRSLLCVIETLPVRQQDLVAAYVDGLMQGNGKKD